MCYLLIYIPLIIFPHFDNAKGEYVGDVTPNTKGVNCAVLKNNIQIQIVDKIRV